MIQRAGLLSLLLALPAFARGGHDSRDAFWRGLLYTASSACTEDDESPVKTTDGKGIRDFAGTVTALRVGFSYGILRVAQPEGDGDRLSPFEQEQALAFPDPPVRASLEAAFSRLFGQPLVAGHARLGLRYDPAGLRAAFDSLYVKPSTQVVGVRAQRLYDALFKAFVAKEANALAELLGHSHFLDEEGRRYATAARGAEFDGVTFQREAAARLGESMTGEDRLIGTVLRRRADGTLPVLIEMLETVLHDYDPATFRELKPRLREREETLDAPEKPAEGSDTESSDPPPEQPVPDLDSAGEQGSSGSR